MNPLDGLLASESQLKRQSVFLLLRLEPDHEGVADPDHDAQLDAQDRCSQDPAAPTFGQHGGRCTHLDPENDSINQQRDAREQLRRDLGGIVILAKCALPDRIGKEEGGEGRVAEPEEAEESELHLLRAIRERSAPAFDVFHGNLDG